MRLYLSSFRLGDHPEHLLGLMRRPGRVVVVANAIDGASEQERRAGVQLELDDLGGLGLEAEELDLRDFAGDPERLAEELADVELCWVRGGSAFVLRHALRISGADHLIPRLLREDALVYAGYSAGGCVLAPDLHGLELCDDPEEVRRLHDAEPTFTGLGVLDFAFVPHVDSPGHPETDLVAGVARHYATAGVAHRTLRDGEALVIDGDRTVLA